jgi:hypothetical protein
VIGFYGGYPSQGLGFITEVLQDSSNMDIIINGFTKRGVLLKPPTPISSSYKGDFLDSETNIFPKFITPPLLWDMEMDEATKGLIFGGNCHH